MIVAANIICIYIMINNITGQIYIGQTNNFWRRINEHFRGHNAKNQWIDRSCLEYGREAFSVKCLEVFEEYDKDLLDEREKYWIEKYDVFKDSNHYNLTIGGDGFGAGEDHPSWRHDLDDDILVDEYVNQGLNCKEIAIRHNTSGTTIRFRLNRLGIDTSLDKKKYRDDLDDDVLVDEYVNQGLSCSEIARKYNAAQSTIGRRLNKLGIDTSRDKPCRDDLNDDVLVDEYVNQGLSCSEIARIHNAAQSTIGRRLNKLGIDTSRDKPCRDDLDDDVLKEDWDAGLTLRQIAEKYNTSSATVWQRLQSIGVDTSRGAYRKNTTGFYRVSKKKSTFL